MNLGERIRQIRKALDLTQESFCKRIGLKRNSISLVESNKRNISDQAIISICREFNVNEEWLRSGTGEMFKASPTEALDALAEEYGLTHGDYILIEKFVNLKAEKRAAVVDYVLQAAAAMQGEGADPSVPAIINKPQTTTKEEKMAAYQEYLDEKEKKRREAN